MKVGNYRLRKTIDGVTHFARVSLRVVDCGISTGAQVEVALESADSTRGEASAGFEPGWISAAVTGARYAIEELDRLGVDVHGIRVLIICVAGSQLDTREDTVACAAAMAFGDALQITTDRIAGRLSFDDSHWKAMFSRE